MAYSRSVAEMERPTGVSLTRMGFSVSPWRNRCPLKVSGLSTGDVALFETLTGPVIDSADERIHARIGTDGSLLLFLSGSDRRDSASGRIANDGTFGLTGDSGRIFNGSIDTTLATSQGEILDGAERTVFYLAGIDEIVGGRLANISTRGVLGSGSRSMIAGIVVEGEPGMRVLIRGVGPGLSAFEVVDRASATELTLREGDLKIDNNRGWESSEVRAELVDLFSSWARSVCNRAQEIRPCWPT